MAGQHIRCSESVQKKLAEIAAREGVPMTKALEILVSTLPMEGKSEDEQFLEELGLGAASTTEPNPAMAEQVSGVMTRLGEITTQLEDFCGNFGQFDQAQKLNIAEVVRQALAEQAPLAQQFHQHCGDRDYPECAEVTNEARKTYFDKGNAAATTRFLKLPGVREQWEIYEEVQAAKARGEDVMHIVG